MPQLHLYVSDELADKIQQEARAANVSVSRYLATLVKREIETDWPEDFFTKVVGRWEGEPLFCPPQGEFDLREDFNIRFG